MKKLVFTLIALLSMSSMYANCYLYIEDFEISSEKLYKVVQVKAHFDHFVSGFQMELTLPEGMKVTDVQRCDDLYIEYTNEEGFTVTATPMIGESQRNTKYLVLNTEVGYYDGSPYGVVKYAPGDYVMYELYIDVPMGFKGGDIQVKSITACGADSRPWVKRCNCSAVITTTHVSVEGVEPDEPEQPTTPYQGYWLVAEGDTINFPRTIRLDLHDHKYDDQPFAYHIIIDGVSFGAQHDGIPTSIEVEDNILIATSHFDYTLEGGRSYIITIWNGIPHYIFLTPIAENNGGADAVDEIVNDRQVASIRYFDIMGREMNEPKGITIVVTTYTDGTTSSTKNLK